MLYQKYTYTFFIISNDVIIKLDIKYAISYLVVYFILNFFFTFHKLYVGAFYPTISILHIIFYNIHKKHFIS